MWGTRPRSGYFSAFSTLFQHPIDVEKWWSLHFVHFTEREVTQNWPVTESWQKLADALRPEHPVWKPGFAFDRMQPLLDTLDITHETLGFIIGARRPSVTAALGRLAERGLVAPWPGGGWLLGHEPPAEVSALRDSERALQPQPQP